MSVLCPDPKVFGYVYQGFIKATFQTECDQFYSSCVHLHVKKMSIDGIHKEGLRLVKSWSYLNELSYNVAIGQMEKIEMLNLIRTNHYTTHPLCAVQLLQYISCIIYNIEISTIKSKKGHKGDVVKNVPDITQTQIDDFKFLEKWQRELMTAIVQHLPEWKNGQWSNPV